MFKENWKEKYMLIPLPPQLALVEVTDHPESLS
jgi:hypothetical protein